MAEDLPLRKRVAVKRGLWRAADLVILLLLIALLYYHLPLVRLHRHGRLVVLAAFLCESWFTFIWLLNINAKWNPLVYRTYPDRLRKRLDAVDDLPAVDMFVTTADPKLEPPLMTVNTVLSLLAVEYPAGKLACYVSDDGCSPVTYYALATAAEFASSWVPFCRKYKVGVRAPSVYFSGDPEVDGVLPQAGFLDDWAEMKSKYESLESRIEEASRGDIPLKSMKGGISSFERGNHPAIVKVVCEGRSSPAEGIPSLVYVAREKRPKQPHHYKAGAMNALTRVSGVMTNAPAMLNVDCDMFVNNPEVLLHAMCLLLASGADETACGFVQCPQRFHGGLEDDPFGNHHVVLQHFLTQGVQGLGCVFYGGTGCFHRRKIIYGETPDQKTEGGILKGVLSQRELVRRFGSSKELQQSVLDTIPSAGISSKSTSADPPAMDGQLTAKVEAAERVASCSYERNTCWGREVGWAYGCLVEDIHTGLRIHSKGWGSVLLDPDPAAFLGNAPVDGPAFMIQFSRWATGLAEIVVAQNGLLWAVLTQKLRFRQFLVYVHIASWGLRSIPELCYALLTPYCAFSGTSFLPKGSQPTVLIPAALFIFYNVYTAAEYRACGLSIRAWWNNQRMQRIQWTTASLIGFLRAVAKVLGTSQTTFQVTPKDQQGSSASAAADEEPGRFTFDASPIFVPGTVLVLLNALALVVIALKMMAGVPAAGAGGGPGVGELVCSGWAVLSFWPFVRGLYGGGKYGLPWSTVARASVLSCLFLVLCQYY